MFLAKMYPLQQDCASGGLVCQNGSCLPPVDPCSPNPCDSPPPDGCSGQIALHYSATGDCTDIGGAASCDYPFVSEDCASQDLICTYGTCTQAGVLISEYVEGTNYNRYVEIYNATSSPVDLDGYKLRLYTNGSTTPTFEIAVPQHILSPGAVYVIGNPSGMLYAEDLSSTGLTFNGNDAIELTDSSLRQLDLIGTIGSTIYFGQDQTLIRKPGIFIGSTAFAPTDWDPLPADTHQLGSHSP